jgi:hypothetical protein
MDPKATHLATILFLAFVGPSDAQSVLVMVPAWDNDLDPALPGNACGASGEIKVDSFVSVRAGPGVGIANLIVRSTVNASCCAIIRTMAGIPSSMFSVETLTKTRPAGVPIRPNGRRSIPTWGHVAPAGSAKIS